jgi:hypothetical protein
VTRDQAVAAGECLALISECGTLTWLHVEYVGDRATPWHSAWASDAFHDEHILAFAPLPVRQRREGE